MARFNLKPIAEPPLLRIEPFKGINLSVTPTQIDDAQSPDMLNMHTDERGALTKRTGYKRIFLDNDIGPINGMTVFSRPDGTNEFLFVGGNKLYKTDVLPGGELRKTTWADDDLSVTWESEFNG